MKRTKALVLLGLFLSIGIVSSWVFYGFQKNKNQNQNPTISSNSGQFEIKKTKDSLEIKGTNSSITLNKVKTEKQDFNIYSDQPRADNLQTEVLFFDDTNLQFEEATITLKKKQNSKKVNAITTCSDQDFNQETQTCKNWQLTNLIPEDQGDFISFKTNHFSAYAGVYIETKNSELLNTDREVIENTHELTKAQDDNWVTVEKDQYLRVEFEEELTKERDITLVVRAKNNQTAEIEIFQKNKNELINKFENINEK